MTQDQRNLIVDYELQKSRINFDQAMLAAQNEYWDLVANRLYYSLFHGVAALLVKNEIPVKSQKGAVMMFNKHYINTGIISIEEGRIISYLQSKREEADYNCFIEIKKQDIEPLIEKSRILIQRIVDLLNA